MREASLVCTGHTRGRAALPDNGTGISGPSGTPKHAWLYDENHGRIKETRTIASGTYAGTRVTWALHTDKVGGLDFESEVNSPTVPSAANPAVTSNRHYLSAGGQVIGVLVTTGALPTLAAGDTAPPVLTSTNAVKLEYWHKDHLGSTAATTDHASALTARYAYDPFGKRRATNGSYDAAGAIVVDWSPAVNNGNDRGFTGHEHLDDVGLVHMNGRVFDPRLGVFLQADPMTQDPYNLQGFNRYGYCLNNPLTCTDPSGLSSWTDFRDKFFKPALLIAFAVVAGPVVYEQVFWLAVSSGLTGSAVTAAAGFAAGAAIGAAQGVLYGGDADDIARSALRGGFTASVFAVAGDAITNSGSFFEVGGTGLPAPAAAAIHGVAGCVTNVVGGAKCGPGAASAAFSKFATVSGQVGDDIVSGTIASAVVGGTASTLGGGKFANGAQTAAFAYLFNEVQHCTSGQNCMKTAGYEPTYYRSEGTLCNGPGDASCHFPGAVGIAGEPLTIQLGVGGQVGAWMLGGAGELGIAVPTTLDDVCIYTQACVIAGPQFVLSAGGAVSIGQGAPSTGVQGSKGFTWFGGDGAFGSVQATMNRDGNIQGARGVARGGIGAGAGTGYVECGQATACVRH